MTKYGALLLLFYQAHAQDICHESLQVFRSCADGAACDCDLFPEVQINLFQNAGLCSTLLNSVCVAKTCCTFSCEGEYQDYEDCIHEFFATSSVQRCHIHCITGTEIPAATLTVAPHATDLQVHVPVETRRYAIPVSAPADHECARDYLSAVACVNNDAQCSDCEIIGPPGNSLELDFCDNVTLSTCTMQHCCDECRDALENYAYCIQDYVFDVTNGNCELDCALVRSEAPSPAPFIDPNSSSNNMVDGDSGVCSQQLNDVAICIGANGCPNCFLRELPSDPEDPDFCSEIADIACSESDCCAPCGRQLDAYGACLSIYALVITSGECGIDCQPAPAQPAFVESQPIVSTSGSWRMARILWLSISTASALLLL